MYDFTLSEEEEMLRKTAADFGAKKLFPLFREAEKAGAVPAELSKAYENLGLAGVELPENWGGAGLSALSKMLVLEGLAAGDAAAAIALDGLGPALYPLLEMRGGEMGAGKMEGDPLAATIKRCSPLRGWVVVDGDESRIAVQGGRARGRWPWIPADKLGLLVILKDGMAHVVTSGLTFTPVKSCALHAAGSCELEIDAPILHTLGGPRGYARCLARLRLYAGALLVGVADASLKYAMTYTQARIVFGKPIAHHQGVAFLIADLAARLDGARLSLHRGAWALSQAGDPTAAAAGAYLDAIDTALEIGEQGVQLLGGHGYMQDHPVEKWMREARTLSTLWGGREQALSDAAEKLYAEGGEAGFALPAWAAGSGA